MKLLLLFVALFTVNASFGSDNQIKRIGATVEGEAYGDLNKDGIAEKVIVLDTGLDGEFGTERVLLILKKIDRKWTLWHASQGPVLPSLHGGMMGDPFQSIDISGGSIVINHFGGSREKWNYTHRYRLNDGVWKLIGATITYGAPCEGFTNFDYNLLTGKALYKQEKDVCPDEPVASTLEDMQKELSIVVSDLPDMDGFYPGSNPIEFKDIGKEIYY